MKAFQYATALATGSAQRMVADNGRYIAGGNDLLGRMKDHITEPKIVVNIKSLPGLDRIERGDETWSIGALVTVAQIESNPEIGKAFSGLQAAAAEVGSQQIRNVATLGGNLAQHSRCWYYRHPDAHCLKKHGDRCYARHGDNRYHSLLSDNPCISPVVSNLATALTALDATAVVLRDGEEKRMNMAELYHLAWENPYANNSLEPGDLILKVDIPIARTSSAYLQISDRHAFDWALVSCAAAAKVTDGRLSHARVALGCISPMPHQVKAANEFLEGKSLDDAAVSHAADLILANAEPLLCNGYKVPLAHTLIRRTLLKLKG